MNDEELAKDREMISRYLSKLRAMTDEELEKECWALISTGQFYWDGYYRYAPLLHYHAMESENAR